MEWLPNGHTIFWFDPADGRLVENRNALTLPKGSRLFNLAYPVHAAKVGGRTYQIVMTASGLGLTLLGSLTMVTFWSRRARECRRFRLKFTAKPELPYASS